MPKIFFTLVTLCLVLFFVGCSQNDNPSSLIDTENPSESQSRTQATIDANLPTSTLTEETIATKYFEATESDVKQKLIGKNKFALFYFAEWSKTCQDIQTEITDALDQLPAETVIAKVDFDKELNLKAQYGVTLESTVLVFDKDGTLQETLVSPNLEQILTSLN